MIDKPPVTFASKLKEAATPGAGGYPYQLSASDLDQNFAACWITSDDPNAFEETIGPNGYTCRKLKGTGNAEKTAFLQVSVTYYAAGSETLGAQAPWMVGPENGVGEMETKIKPGTYNVSTGPILGYTDGILRIPDSASDTTATFTGTDTTAVSLSYKPASRIQLILDGKAIDIDASALAAGETMQVREIAVCEDGVSKTAKVLMTLPVVA